MRKNIISRIAAALIIAAVLISSVPTVFAVEGESPISIPENEDPGYGDNGELPYEEPTYFETPTDPASATDAPADNGDGGNGYDEVIEGIEATEAPTVAPTSVSDLPEVGYYDIIEATAVVLPDVEVSDASLFSGLVMWLCVAVGIAVVVGVMASKRTRRRG